jgi:hypothetical protein
MIISLSGYSGSGKDTVGTIIQYLLCPNHDPNVSLEDILKEPEYHQWWLEDESKWEVKKWAGKLKTIASMLTGIPKEKFEDQEFKKTMLGSEWNMSVRDFLQKLGTDAIRDGLHTNAWVNALMADYIPTQVQWSDGPIGGYEDGPLPNWIITDTRFPNEAQAIKDAGGLVIRVDRPGVKPINNHPSEVGLDNWDFDYKIANVSDLRALTGTVETILLKENIL